MGVWFNGASPSRPRWLGAPEMYLSLLPQHWYYKHMLNAYLCYLGSGTQNWVFSLAQQTI